MSDELKLNKISKSDFLKINEDDVMFITNPGRMGDEDGSTFIVKENNEFKAYRVNGWMYRNENNDILEEEARKQFPKWWEVCENWNNESYKGKYKYIYMGFGNGLSVDNRVYDEFKPYLDKRVEKYLKDKDDKESLKYAAVFNTWEQAFMDMINDKRVF